MNKKLLIFSLALFTSISMFAQWGGPPPPVSPEIHADNTVTFRLRAPYANNVYVQGDFMQGRQAMTQDENGVWSFTTPVLPSEMYNYSFVVDGLQMYDPSNFRRNHFFILGGQADYYVIQDDIPRGSVTHRWYYSPQLGMNRRVTIYTPPSYETSGNRYPVLYLLHGIGGNEDSWINDLRTAQILDNLIARGKAQPMIVVMPNGNVAQQSVRTEQQEGFYTPSTDWPPPHTMDGRFEETFMDIINFVDASLRTIPEKSGRAIAGLSMGGFHTMHISRFHPNTFDYIGVFSGAGIGPVDASSIVYQDIEGGLRRQMENGFQLYWLAMERDSFQNEGNLRFLAKLGEMGFPYSYHWAYGGHTPRNWRAYLVLFVQMLFQQR